MNTDEHRWKAKKKSVFICVHLWIIIFALFLAACSELEKPKTEPFYAETAPPQKKEFRWSNGKMPKSFDPARAAAPPETDIVRACFEGLTDTNAKNLEAIPSVAEKWTASADFKTWTFYLRKDVKWSNGELLTADDFVSSWKRLVEMGENVSHPQLLENIAGAKIPKPETAPPSIKEESNSLVKPVTDQNLPIFNSNTNTAQKAEPKLTPNAAKTPLPNEKDAKEKTVKEKEKKPPEVKFGVEALDDFVLRVTLKESDKDFPKLVAHPMFRPIYGDGAEFETGKLNAAIVTNGAFRISSVGQNSITLDRADNFWAKNSVEIERVSFIANQSAEKALESYRNGEVDAVTNANFEPLALKLLAPYEDFKRETHSALNFYEINRHKKPFDDVRVREALAISIERERLTEIETDGAARPALSFLPFDEENTKKIVQDKSRAKELLTEAGFDDGEDFPVIKLVVNRNDVQQRIAKAVVKMWKQTLNIDTVIVVREASEIEMVRQNGDFDILRRGVVFPTADETAGLTAIFEGKESSKIENPAMPQKTLKQTEIAAANSNSVPQNVTEETLSNTQTQDEKAAEIVENNLIPNEDEAIEEIHSIPLYFPTSYSLVKPYIQGFEINTLDAPSLKDVKIDNNWQPKKPNGES